MSDKQLSELLFPANAAKPEYKMPDYEYVAHEMQKSGVTLNLLWLEYCEQCRNYGELPYQLTQFKKYYRDYTAKSSATMHLDHRPGEIMKVDWAGDTAHIIDTIQANLFRYMYLLQLFRTADIPTLKDSSLLIRSAGQQLM